MQFKWILLPNLRCAPQSHQKNRSFRLKSEGLSLSNCGGGNAHPAEWMSRVGEKVRTGNMAGQKLSLCLSGGGGAEGGRAKLRPACAPKKVRTFSARTVSASVGTGHVRAAQALENARGDFGNSENGLTFQRSPKSALTMNDNLSIFPLRFPLKRTIKP